MYNTTVANANFIIQTQTIFLAIFGYIFFKRKNFKNTLVSIILAISGIILMLGDTLSFRSNVRKYSCFCNANNFCYLILIVRKYPNVDMVPLQFIAGILAMIIGYLMSSKILISPNDIFLAFFSRFFKLV